MNTLQVHFDQLQFQTAFWTKVTALSLIASTAISNLNVIVMILEAITLL